MEKLSTEADIKAAILFLEVKQEEERILLKNEFRQAYESMKPINLIKSTFKEIRQSPDIRDKLINTGVGLATGYVSKVLFEKATHSLLRKFLGTALMFGVTRVITKNPELIKSAAKGLFKIIKNATSHKDVEGDADTVKEKI